jgi:hypothetical protein
MTGLILGHLVVTLPFTVRLVSISVHNLDPAPGAGLRRTWGRRRCRRSGG